MPNTPHPIDLTPSDAALVERARGGDESAAAVLVRRHQRAVFGVCLRMLGRREDAEDAAQETLLRMFRHLDRWDPARPLRPWLLTIAANRCRTALTKRATRGHVTPGELDPADEGVPLSDAALAEELQRAVDTLRPDHKAAFVLFHHEELSLQEVAEALGRPDGTIKTWLHRARKHLAEALARRGVTPTTHADPAAGPRSALTATPS